MEMIRKKGKILNIYVPDYVVFDIETTGISIQKDKIIELSAVKVKEGKVVEEFSSLVNPRQPIPFEAYKVNGISDEMVAGEPFLEEVLPKFLDFTKNEIVVGHNIASFDTNFIYDAAYELFGHEFQNDYIDTLKMARARLPMLSHHKLSDVANYFSIDVMGAHRALNDCMINYQCFEALGKLKVEEKDICPQCGSPLVKRNGKFGAFYGCSSYPGCKFTRRA